MRVLLLTQVLPYPPDSGPKIKTWNVLKYLAQQYDVTLVSFVRGDQTAEVNQLKNYCRVVYVVPISRGTWGDCWYMIKSLLTHQPFLIVRDDRAAMHEVIKQLTTATQFDIIHVDQLNMAQYAERVTGACKVLDAHNALWLLYKRLWETMPPGPKKWLLGRDWRLLKQYEGEICRRFEGLLTVSEEDKVALQEAAGLSLEATVIPIAVDTDEIVKIRRCAEADHILHIGTMFWPPNIDGVLWFLHEIFPLIQVKRPKITFDVVGAKPPPEIMAYNSKGSGVNVAGYVDDPTPYYKAAGVMVVPLRAGGGMRVKILNALAQGLPIVSTTLGCEGIAVEPGRHLLIADTPESFAQATILLLEDKRLANELGYNGRQLVQSTYDFRVACDPLDVLYRQVIAAQR